MGESSTELLTNREQKNDSFETRALATKLALDREGKGTVLRDLAYQSLYGDSSPQVKNAAKEYLKAERNKLVEALQGKRDVQITDNDLVEAQKIVEEYNNPDTLIKKVTYPFVRIGIKRMGDMLRKAAENQPKQPAHVKPSS